MAEEKNPFGGLFGLGAEPPRPSRDYAAELERARNVSFEQSVMAAPTSFVNKYYLQRYGDGNFRIVVAEQFSSDPDVLPAPRGAIFMHSATAVHMAYEILRLAGRVNQLTGEVQPASAGS